MPNEKQFVGGLIAKAPHEKAPEFVKCNLSIKRVELISWLTGKSDEWINVDVKVGKSGKWYAEESHWKPKPKEPQVDPVFGTVVTPFPPQDTIRVEDIPF